jgi:hypothetical protein
MSVIAMGAMGAEGTGEGSPGQDSMIMGESRTATSPDAEIEAEPSEKGADDVAGGPKDGDIKGA